MEDLNEQNTNLNKTKSMGSKKWKQKKSFYSFVNV